MLILLYCNEPGREWKQMDPNQAQANSDGSVRRK